MVKKAEYGVDCLYLSIDINVLDPAYAPGVSSPEPGGLTTRELLKFLKHILNRQIAGIDIVETNPLRDINNATLNVIRSLSYL